MHVAVITPPILCRRYRERKINPFCPNIASTFIDSKKASCGGGRTDQSLSAQPCAASFRLRNRPIRGEGAEFDARSGHYTAYFVSSLSRRENNPLNLDLCGQMPHESHVSHARGPTRRCPHFEDSSHPYSKAKSPASG